MAVFEYKALDEKGKQVQGVKEADSPRQVRQILRDQGWTPLDIFASKEKKNNEKNLNFNLPFLGRKLSTSGLALITRQLATLVQAAMPIEESLMAISAQQEKRWIKNLMLSVRSQVMEGFTLAQSLDAYPQHFPQMYRATVAAGEHAGHLDKVLLRLADHAEQSMQSRQKVQLALLYPVILMLASVGIVSFLLGYVVPDIVKVFIDSGQQLPTITTILISASEWFQVWWPWLFLSIAALIIAVNRILKRPKIRLKFHGLILKTPVIGRFSQALNTAQFASTLSILTRSGVSLVEALNIAAKVVSNDTIRASVLDASRKVREGTSLYRSLGNTGHFPPLMLHMISSGESTGELDTMLERIATNQHTELENRISMLVGLFEPIMLVVMGGIVMTIVLAILLPILNMNTLIGS